MRAAYITCLVAGLALGQGVPNTSAGITSPLNIATINANFIDAGSEAVTQLDAGSVLAASIVVSGNITPNVAGTLAVGTGGLGFSTANIANITTNSIAAGNNSVSLNGINPRYVSGAANSGTNIAHVFNTTNTLGGSTSLLQVQNNTTPEFTVDNAGNGTFIGNVTANGVQLRTSVDIPINFYTAQTTGSGLIHAMTMTNAGTFRSANFYTDVTGVGGGNFVIKVCLDGTTCAAGNTAWTCTMACTSSSDTATSCTAGSATTWTAGATISASISTACATTNQVGGLDLGNTEP